jgi:hypothetical protein
LVAIKLLQKLLAGLVVLIEALEEGEIFGGLSLLLN